MLETLQNFLNTAAQALGPDVFEEVGTQIGGPLVGRLARTVAEHFCEVEA